MTILGMNRRNALIARLNPREAIKGVNQKFETKGGWPHPECRCRPPWR